MYQKYFPYRVVRSTTPFWRSSPASSTTHLACTRRRKGTAKRWHMAHRTAPHQRSLSRGQPLLIAFGNKCHSRILCARPRSCGIQLFFLQCLLSKFCRLPLVIVEKNTGTIHGTVPNNKWNNTNRKEARLCFGTSSQ